jgi:hypothetical protein
MPAPNCQNGTGVTAETVSYREKEGYRHENGAERQRLRSPKGFADGGNAKRVVSGSKEASCKGDSRN